MSMYIICMCVGAFAKGFTETNACYTRPSRDATNLVVTNNWKVVYLQCT